MVDKLYSRPKIRLPNFRKLNSVKTILLILFFSIIIFIVVFLRMAYPVFKGTCETAAASKGNKIINDEVNKVMKNYTYNNLITFQKDSDEKITCIEANTILINEIVTQIVRNIQLELDKIPRTNVAINMGAVSGISVLKNFDPKFRVELESAGNINSTLRTEFKSVGINQTHHKIYLKIDTKIVILTPLANFNKNIDTEVLLTEAVIVGDVPETYYNLDGFDETEDIYNFMK